MSHLSILPTVLRDTSTLVSALRSIGLEPTLGGQLEGFGGERLAVDVQVCCHSQRLGWQRQNDGRLALVADLQRLSQSTAVHHLLARLTRAYAVRDALRQAERDPALGSASVTVIA
jgi:uncharacterized protein YdiU (UPF0061 family)